MLDSVLKILNRSNNLFTHDINNNEDLILDQIKKSKFLVLGGAGSIGQAVVKEIFKRNPLKLHVVDLSENNLVELVRDLRSSIGYGDGEFKTFTLDIGSQEYDAFINSDGRYDYVLNLSALKHVRSEKDPYTLMRMINVNIFNTEKTIKQSIAKGVKKYFCVSTDKAANPVNMMGASKRIMELYLMKYSSQISISTARFANVAFSDGSLLQGFTKRIEKQQPIAAPNDIKRYFVTPKESGELCLMSCLFGESGDVFFPKLSEELDLIKLSTIAENYLKSLGYTPYECNSEDEARELIDSLVEQKKWPCLFSGSDTTGEKGFEEFYTKNEKLDLKRFQNLGIIKNEIVNNDYLLTFFSESIEALKSKGVWSKKEIVDLFKEILPDFDHVEVGKNLDAKM